MALTEPHFTLPADAVARLHMLPDAGRHTWVVIVARKPMEATPAAFTRRGGLSAVLSHDEGLCWPDRRGEALAAETLRIGGAVGFAFRSLADALGCKGRLEGGTA